MHNTVIIDTDKLYAELKAQGKTKSGFALELGRSRTYIENLKRSPSIPDGMERVISIMLGKEAGFFIKREEEKKQNETSGKEAQILVNITVRLKELSEKMDMILTKLSEMDERDEKTYSKVHANTLQLETVKDHTREIAGALKLTDYDKAVKFLRETLSGGRMNGEEIIRMADAAGIKRADLNKAKRDLHVDTAATGYGKAQKTWWFLTD